MQVSLSDTKEIKQQHTVVSRPLVSNCFNTGLVSVLNTFSRFSIAKVVSSGRLSCGSRCSSFCLRRCSLHSRTMTASTRPTYMFISSTNWQYMVVHLYSFYRHNYDAIK